MVTQDYWWIAYQHEFEHALSARSSGNEGMARVCARRAAGIVIGEYLERRGVTNLTHSAYGRLTMFTDLPDVNQNLKLIVGHFLLKVDHDQKLPGNIDLIADVQFLENELLNNNIY